MNLRRFMPESFMIYYGEANPTIYQQLAHYDLVILEPQHHQRESIKGLSSQGTFVLGYLSVLESPRWNRNRFSKLRSLDFLQLDGEPVYLQEWDAYVMDLRQQSYRDLLISEASHIIQEKGCSGLFLDTLDDMDNRLAPSVQKKFHSAYQQWLELLRQLHPEVMLVQNRGFNILPKISPLLDGILWEDWNGFWQSDGWMKEQVRQIKKAQNQGLRVFSICESQAPIHQHEAEKCGFLHLTRDRNYHDPLFFERLRAE